MTVLNAGGAEFICSAEPAGNLRVGMSDGSTSERRTQIHWRRCPGALTVVLGSEFGFRYARVGQLCELPTELDAIGLRRGHPVLVLVGGAGGISEDDLLLTDTVLRAVMLPVLEKRTAVVVDGGTDSGVMRVVGRARADTYANFPLVGVAAEGTVIAPDQLEHPPSGAAKLEPYHTHVILVPGTSWGDESPWLAHVADAIADALDAALGRRSAG
jgi:SLOG in TRPM, prokaryote